MFTEVHVRTYSIAASHYSVTYLYARSLLLANAVFSKEKEYCYYRGKGP